jgi:hypothetical protein
VVSGVTYYVGYDAFEPAIGNTDPPRNMSSLSISLAGTMLGTINSNNLSGAPVWNNVSYTFTATSSGPATFVLSYAGGESQGQDFLVDKAFVTPTPEPGYYGAVTIGLAGLFAVTRGRRAQ